MASEKQMKNGSGRSRKLSVTRSIFSWALRSAINGGGQLAACLTEGWYAAKPPSQSPIHPLLLNPPSILASTPPGKYEFVNPSLPCFVGWILSLCVNQIQVSLFPPVRFAVDL
jgi:hypothetical protein